MASSWGSSWGNSWGTSWGDPGGGGGGVTVTFHRGLSSPELGANSLSEIVHALTDAGGGTYTVTVTTTVSVDKVGSLSKEDYETS
jgi:hypothetical protein